MTQPNVPAGAPASNLELKGGAAIVAPVSAFPGGVPGNALVVVPLSKPDEELVGKLKEGPLAVTSDQMWKLLGFNGPAVQVQDQQGRPIAIGLEDLLAGLEKHWQENKTELNRGRLYAQELMKYGRYEKAEKVLSKVVAGGGGGEDWLALGVSQLNQKSYDKAIGTLKGAQNLLKENPFPSLHLAKALGEKGDHEAEREAILQAIETDANCIDAWAYLFTQARKQDGEEAALALVDEVAAKEANAKTAAPYIAVQGVFAGNQETRDKAMTYAEKAVERNPDDPLALVSLSALLGQKGDLPKVVELLSKHEAKMTSDVRLANNYFEALFQTRQIEKVTKLLNALAGSSNKEVKQFAVERSRAVQQFLKQQQQQLLRSTQAPQS